MKKFCEVTGRLVLSLVVVVCIVAISSGIVITYYEDEKHELFFEVMEFFNTFNQDLEETLMRDNGIVIDVDSPDSITNI